MRTSRVSSVIEGERAKDRKEREPVTVALKSEPRTGIQFRLYLFEISVRGRQAHALDEFYIQIFDVPALYAHICVVRTTFLVVLVVLVLLLVSTRSSNRRLE